MKRWNANTTATFLTRVGVLTPRPSPPHEPEGRAGCPQRAGNGAKPPSLLRRGESVSVQIVASRDDFAERGHPGRSVSPTRESRELTDVSAVGNRCAQDGRAPFRLRLHRAALYRRFPNRQRVLRGHALLDFAASAGWKPATQQVWKPALRLCQRSWTASQELSRI